MNSRVAVASNQYQGLNWLSGEQEGADGLAPLQFGKRRTMPATVRPKRLRERLDGK
jgi:hypothetical protein